MATVGSKIGSFIADHMYGLVSSAPRTAIEAMNNATDGTQAAGSLISTDININQGIIKVTAWHIGTSGSETQVNATMAEINQGADLSVRGEIVTVTNVMVAADNGKIFFLDAATEFVTTLPALAGTLGFQCQVIVKAAAASADYTLVENGSDSSKIVCEISENDTTTSTDGEYSATGSTVTFTNASSASTVGDWIDVYSDGVFWYITGHARVNQGMAIT